MISFSLRAPQYHCWQMLCERTGAILKVIPMNDEGELIMAEYDKLLTDKTKSLL
jgi:selenocysteine lyase/cysteine desulfurase